MESYFEFNVSLNGRHYFATAPLSFPSCQRDKAIQFYRELCRLFPEAEGFNVSVTRWECVGHPETLAFIKEGRK